MEENELQELPVYLHQLAPEELNSKLLDLIGSRGLLEFIKNKLGFLNCFENSAEDSQIITAQTAAKVQKPSSLD